MPDAAKLQYLFTCDAVANSPDGKSTFYGLFTTIRTTALPCKHHHMVVVYGIRIAGSCTVKLRLVSPGGEVVADFPEVPIDMEAGTLIGGQFEIRNAVFSDYGEYRIELLVCDDVLADTPLIIEELGKEGSDG